MLTLEKLAEFGINTKEGLGRCMNNEKFYFKMVGMGLSNEYFEKLEEAVREKDMEQSFEAAHALKGVMGNLSLTPLYKPLAEMTELLREKQDADYVSMYRPVKELRDKLLVMQNEA